MIAVTLHPQLVLPSIEFGLADASFYVLFAVALVLTYRISHTIAFIHYGFAVVGSLGFWLLTYNTDPRIEGNRPGLAPMIGLVIVVAIGAILGAGYGRIMTHRRICRLPRLTLTMISVAGMLILAGFMTRSDWLVNPNVVPKSPFGQGRLFIDGTAITYHRLIMLAVSLTLVGVLTVALERTRAGVHIRAIADDVEASTWAGINLPRLGTSVYAIAGATSALAGALLTPILGADPFAILFVFICALIASVVGGFRSLGLALVGSTLLSVVDSSIRSGVFGSQKPGTDGLVIILLVLLVTIIVSRVRRALLEVIQVENL